MPSGRWVDSKKTGGMGVGEDIHGFMDELQSVFPDVVITSGKREGDGHSHHAHGNAVDINHNPQIYNYLMNTPEGLSLMDKYKLGIYDESNPNIMAKTKASGAHFHIGKDQGLYSHTSSRLGALKEGKEIPKAISFIEANPNFDYSKYKAKRNWGDYEGKWDSYNSDKNVSADGYDFSNISYSAPQVESKPTISFTIPDGKGGFMPSYVSEEEFKKEIESALEKDNEEKAMMNESAEAKAINDEMNSRMAFLKEYEQKLMEQQKEQEYSFGDVQEEQQGSQQQDDGYEFQDIAQVSLELPELPKFSTTMIDYGVQNELQNNNFEVQDENE